MGNAIMEEAESKFGTKVRKLDNLSDISDLNIGDLIITTSSIISSPKLRVYEGLVDGKMAFMERGIVAGHISSWQIRKDNISGFNRQGGISFHSADVEWVVYTPSSRNYVEKLAILQGAMAA